MEDILIEQEPAMSRGGANMIIDSVGRMLANQDDDKLWIIKEQLSPESIEGFKRLILSSSPWDDLFGDFRK